VDGNSGENPNSPKNVPPMGQADTFNSSGIAISVLALILLHQSYLLHLRNHARNDRISQIVIRIALIAEFGGVRADTQGQRAFCDGNGILMRSSVLGKCVKYGGLGVDKR